MPKPVYPKQRKLREAYCNVKPLKECCGFPSGERGLGLTFGEEFTHVGLNKQMVDCEYETVTINTKSAGGPKNAEDVEGWQEKMILFIVSDIEKIIKELAEHRDRLLADLAESQGIPF